MNYKDKTEMKSTKIKRPIYSELYAVMKEICSVPNPWAFCLSWQTDNPKLFNKFMDMCAYFKKDDSFISHKVKEPEYLYHKLLKMDVSVNSTIPDEKGRICFWHTNRWLHDKKELFSEPKGTF